MSLEKLPFSLALKLVSRPEEEDDFFVLPKGWTVEGVWNKC